MGSNEGHAMRRNRLKITLTEDEERLFRSLEGRHGLASTIVELALKQAEFTRKAASGAFRKPTGQPSAGRPANDDGRGYSYEPFNG